MKELNQKKCLPCAKACGALASEELNKFLLELGESWRIEQGKKLLKPFIFKNFKEALSFVNQIGALAEQEGHHPDLLLSYGKVLVELFTHKVGGLTESDFILAEKIDALYISKTAHP
jgi:4a-hydroxytetrahydrobiopterin dehydratase